MRVSPFILVYNYTYICINSTVCLHVIQPRSVQCHVHRTVHQRPRSCARELNFGVKSSTRVNVRSSKLYNVELNTR